MYNINNWQIGNDSVAADMYINEYFISELSESDYPSMPDTIQIQDKSLF